MCRVRKKGLIRKNYNCTNEMKVLLSEESERHPLLFDLDLVPSSSVESDQRKQ